MWVSSGKMMLVISLNRKSLDLKIGRVFKSMLEMSSVELLAKKKINFGSMICWVTFL